MRFTDDIGQDVSGGDYNYTVVLGGGTCTLTFSIEGNPFVAVPDGAFAGDESGIITFGNCKVKAGLTGAATFVMARKR